MKVRTIIVISSLLALAFTTAQAGSPFSKKLCNNNSDEYDCMSVKKNSNWEKLFPDSEKRDIVKRVNRTNLPLHRGQVIAVPKNLDQSTAANFSPFTQKIAATGKNKIIVNPNTHAWAAYDADGNQVKWGAASTGGDYCKDVHRRCHTAPGNFAVYSKGSAACKSGKYPLPNGGAPTPYCMHYYKGFALHGSKDVPGYNASHGCVRLFVEDAKWLNEHFVNVGTKVTVLPYATASKASTKWAKQPAPTPVNQTQHATMEVDSYLN